MLCEIVGILEILFIQKLMSNNNDNDNNNALFLNITHDISGSDRQNLYLSGGCISITSRILVTDLLNNMIPFKSITGILVNNAHELCKSHNLCFVLEIFRHHNRRGFVKGFSQNADRFIAGYATLRDIMSRLFVNKVSIWPRFRVCVDESFKRRLLNNNTDIVELHVNLSSNMIIIQECIMEIMEACLNEFKTTSFVKISNITIENGLFNDFQNSLYISFKPHWNKLSIKTKNLISDLINLKRLLKYLVSYNSITFYRHLMSMKRASFDSNTNTPKSIWLQTDSANKLFKCAKQRVYQWFNGKSLSVESSPKCGQKRKRKRDSNQENKRRKLNENNNNHNRFFANNIDSDNKNKNMDENGLLEVILEINPKWNVLISAIREIRKLQHEHEDKLTAPILIVCRNQSTAKQLSNILCFGAKELMNKYWYKYLSHINYFNHFQIGENVTDHQREINCLISYFSKLRDEMNKQQHIDEYLVDINDDDDDDDKNKEDEQEDEDDIDPFIELRNEEEKQKQDLLSNFENENNRKKSPVLKGNHSKKKLSESELQQFAFSDALDQLCVGLINAKYIKNECKVVIHGLNTIDGENNSNLLLWQLKPEFVILYDNNLKFIRELEIFHSYYNQQNLRIYLLTYSSSIEEQIYLSNVRREKESFLKLINEKGDMVLPQNINGKIDKSILKLPSQQFGVIEKSKRSQIVNTINIVNSSNNDRVIVDIREFRSSTSLPLMLYRENINVIPVTLKVGDYILSPSLCVERKCLNDLFSSIIHGRLYDQILQITRYYAIPILLIEFDQNKSFSLQNIKEIPQNINLSNIISKLSILTIHFNKLTILWSRCPQLTTKLFKVLKANRPQPDLNTAITITNENANQHDDDQDNEDMHTPKDILRSLPGVNHKNVNKILQTCQSLKDLCSKSKEELFDILGIKDGKLLYDFLHTNYFN